MNNTLKWGLGLAALGVTVYVAGRAWKKSQNKNSGMAGFAGAAGNPRLRAIASSSRGGAPQYACNCSCGRKVMLRSGQTKADCSALCRDACS
jgi:hypothetical protein